MTVKNLFSRMLNFAKPSRTRKRWSKASEAKNHVKHILRDLKSDRNAVEKVRKYLESSLENPITEEMAGEVYEQLCTKWVLELIQGFCECILDNFPLLVKECSFAALPPHVQEALASLVFASRRCESMRAGKRMELLRELFGERYAPCGGEDEEVMDCKVHVQLRNKYFCEDRLTGDGYKFVPQKEEYEEEQKVELSVAEGVYDDAQELSTDQESYEEHELIWTLTDDDDEQELNTDRESDEEHELSFVETGDEHDNEGEEEREMNAGQEHDEEHELSSVETGNVHDNEDEEERKMKDDEDHKLSVETADGSEVEEQLSDQERKEQKLGDLLIDLSWVREFESYRKQTIYLGRHGQ